jgi:hypothetical protein
LPVRVNLTKHVKPIMNGSVMTKTISSLGVNGHGRFTANWCWRPIQEFSGAAADTP